MKIKKRILFTGFVPSTLAEMERMARDLGAEVVLSSQSCLNATHMVMPRLGRTVKFLCAIPHVKHVLKPEWVSDSHKEKAFKGKGTEAAQHPSFPSTRPTMNLATSNVIVYIFSLSDESEYELHDEEFEDKFSCDLKGLLQANEV